MNRQCSQMTFRLDYILDVLSEFEDEQVIKTYK